MHRALGGKLAQGEADPARVAEHFERGGDITYARADIGSASKTTFQPLAGLGFAYAITPSVRLGLEYSKAPTPARPGPTSPPRRARATPRQRACWPTAANASARCLAMARAA